MGSALIAGLLSGIFVIVGVLLGARLQTRNTEREHARATAAQRDEIIAGLRAPVATLTAQALMYRGATHRLRTVPVTVKFKAFGETTTDPRVTAIEAELTQLYRDMIPAINDISVASARLRLLEPAMRPLLTRLNDAVNSLLANTGAPEEEFTKHRAELRHVALEIDQMRDKLAEAEQQQQQQQQPKQGKMSQNSQEKQNES
jgi:hypothetical protein